MFDGLMLCHPLGSGRAFAPYFAETVMIELRKLSNSQPVFDEHQLLGLLLFNSLSQLRPELGYIILVESVLGETSTALNYVFVPTKTTQNSFKLRMEVLPPASQDRALAPLPPGFCTQDTDMDLKNRVHTVLILVETCPKIRNGLPTSARKELQRLLVEFQDVQIHHFQGINHMG